METLKALHTRNSVASLSEPAPTQKEMELVFQAALRASDHARLSPWRFIEVTGEGRKKLGNAFLKTAKDQNKDIYQKL